MDNRYTAANVINNITRLEEEESAEKRQDVVNDYFDYEPIRFAMWKLSAKDVKFHICEEVINNKEKHVAQMVLLVFKGEKLKEKLASLKQLGYTAKYVKQL